MGKSLGLIVSLLGVLVIVWNFAFKTIKIPLLSDQKDVVIIAIGVVLVVAGFFFMKGKSKGKGELPIYRGNRVIGYRQR